MQDARCKTLWLGGKQRRQTRKFACFGMARCKTLWLVGWEAKQANSAACLRWYSAMPEAMVGREAKQAQVCLLWYSAMPAVWLWEGKQANSQVCLLWYSAMLDAMVGREAKCMFASFGIARCKTLWLGGKEGRQTRKLACFGVARWKRYGWAGSTAGKLACLPALV